MEGSQTGARETDAARKARHGHRHSFSFYRYPRQALLSSRKRPFMNRVTAILIRVVLLASGPGVAHALQDASLVAYYPFNGSANDESGHMRDGAVFGATLAPDRFGTPNSAFYFDGNDYIKASATGLPTGERTVAFWFNASYPLDKPAMFG